MKRAKDGASKGMQEVAAANKKVCTSEVENKGTEVPERAKAGGEANIGTSSSSSESILKGETKDDTASTGSTTLDLDTMLALQAIAMGDLGPALKVKPGSNLEVLWTLENDETREEELVWWKCTVEEKTEETHDLGAGGSEEGEEVVVPIYKLKYEARDSFPECTNTVCFTDEHQLFDIEFDGYLEWRHSGEIWSPSSVDDTATNNSTPTNPVLALFDKLREKDLPALREALGVAIAGDACTIDGEQPSPQDAAERLVNRILENILKRHDKKMKTMPISVQFMMVDKIKRTREQLVGQIATHLESKGMLDESASLEIVNNLSGNK